VLLGVNIDHIAVLREARKTTEPDPLDAVSIVKVAGADQITIHLREDRRHIDEYDTEKIIKYSALPVNLEASMNAEIINIASNLKPFRVTLVPEKREEVTTEGGLDIRKNFESIKKSVEILQRADIEVSLFIDPDRESISYAKDLGVNMVELHTGKYANVHAMLYSNLSKTKHSIDDLDLPRQSLKVVLENSIKNIEDVAKYGKGLGVAVAAGHGLNYQNVSRIAKIEEIEELNIGQSIIARSVFIGLESAIKEMLERIR
jgi:pyridoxine 5-phosphate synthase